MADGAIGEARHFQGATGGHSPVRALYHLIYLASSQANIPAVAGNTPGEGNTPGAADSIPGEEDSADSEVATEDNARMPAAIS